jgi:hypothetical protein
LGLKALLLLFVCQQHYKKKIIDRKKISLCIHKLTLILYYFVKFRGAYPSVSRVPHRKRKIMESNKIFKIFTDLATTNKKHTLGRRGREDEA